MDLLDHFSRMAGNNLWSNDRLYRAVLALEAGRVRSAAHQLLPVDQGDAQSHPGGRSALSRYAGGGRRRRRHLRRFRAVRSCRQSLHRRRRRSTVRLIDFCEPPVSRRSRSPRHHRPRARTARSPNASATSWRICSSTRSTIAARCTRCCRAPRSKPPQLDEFFLDYDLKLRSEEVERLGLRPTDRSTSCRSRRSWQTCVYITSMDCLAVHECLRDEAFVSNGSRCCSGSAAVPIAELRLIGRMRIRRRCDIAEQVLLAGQFRDRLIALPSAISRSSVSG